MENVKRLFIIGIALTLVFFAVTPLVFVGWAATDTVYVDFTPEGNVTINAYGYHDFQTIYSGQTKNTDTTTFTAENNGSTTLGTVTVQCTSNTGTLTAVDSSPSTDQFAIQAQDDSGDLGSWTGIKSSAQTIENDLASSGTETFGIQIELGQLSSQSPGAVNCTITVEGTD
ncbi:MAG: hypothetical protein V5A64_02995 [Candidatus Thermoplasmatota archaeon]